jgi:hypothetical protein
MKRWWFPGNSSNTLSTLVALLILTALSYFAAWQLGIAVTLIAVGVYVWWHGREPRPDSDPAA